MQTIGVILTFFSVGNPTQPFGLHPTNVNSRKVEVKITGRRLKSFKPRFVVILQRTWAELFSYSVRLRLRTFQKTVPI